MGRRVAHTERRAWLEHPGAAQRVAELVGCQVQDVADATIEDVLTPGQQVLTVTVVRHISERDAYVLTHGQMVAQRG